MRILIQFFIILFLGFNVSKGQSLFADMKASQHQTRNTNTYQSKITYSLVKDGQEVFHKKITIKKDSQYYYMDSEEIEIVMDTNYLVIANHSAKTITVSKPRPMGYRPIEKLVLDSNYVVKESSFEYNDSSRRVYSLRPQNPSKRQQMVLEYDTLLQCMTKATIFLTDESNKQDTSNYICYKVKSYSNRPTLSRSGFDTGTFITVTSGGSVAIRSKYTNYRLINLL